MFVHEYSDRHFDTYEECRENVLLEVDIDEDDIANEMDIKLPEVIARFLCPAGYGQPFEEWFREEIECAINCVIDGLITEYEEGEVE